MQRDIQELIPEIHRDLIEVVPRGFAKSAVMGALLLGAVAGALLATFIPDWIVAVVPAVLLVVQRIWVRKSNKNFDQRIAELKARGLDWKIDEDY